MRGTGGEGRSGHARPRGPRAATRPTAHAVGGGRGGRADARGRTHRAAVAASGTRAPADVPCRGPTADVAARNRRAARGECADGPGLEGRIAAVAASETGPLRVSGGPDGRLRGAQPPGGKGRVCGRAGPGRSYRSRRRLRDRCPCGCPGPGPRRPASRRATAGRQRASVRTGRAWKDVSQPSPPPRPVPLRVRGPQRPTSRRAITGRQGASVRTGRAWKVVSQPSPPPRPVPLRVRSRDPDGRRRGACPAGGVRGASGQGRAWRGTWAARGPRRRGARAVWGGVRWWTPPGPVSGSPRRGTWPARSPAVPCGPGGVWCAGGATGPVPTS